MEIYSLADVFVNPTTRDTFPTVNIEALACGVPVVTYNTGGSPESVGFDGKYGIVTDEKTPEALLKAIITIKKKGKVYYSDNCREHVIEKYDSNDKYQEYVDLYDDLISLK